MENFFQKNEMFGLIQCPEDGLVNNYMKKIPTFLSQNLMSRHETKVWHQFTLAEKFAQCFLEMFLECNGELSVQNTVILLDSGVNLNSNTA